jgi:carbamoyl-phosphate synthase large subunit
MPARTDIESILVIGSGPIVIGQACEFDYAGTQACRVLRQQGYRVILANSNPATIMTDPSFADATYVEPLSPEVLEAILAKERPDALLPTLGGQTALNLAVSLAESGALASHGVKMLGASLEAIHRAEDRSLFKETMTGIGLAVPRSGFAHSLEEALALVEEIGLPVIIRPSFILGGAGTGLAYDRASFTAMVVNGLAASPVREVLIERSVLGWKEFELEVMRDRADNCVVVCSIENFDAMGVHTGDSITVAPAQTLSDPEYQAMRDQAFACIRAIGVETGGSNIQFALDPTNGEMVVIEMNPRVSRSSALASKATGFPIAKIAALLAVGWLLPEITNDITRKTPASFEPTIDYVVTKVPRWSFEKFPEASGQLGTAMQSVGEVMAIGRSFPESLQKALRSLEQGRYGLNCDPAEQGLDQLGDDQLLAAVAVPTPARSFQIEAALRRGLDPAEIARLSRIDPWFLDQLGAVVDGRRRLAAIGSAGRLPSAKEFWYLKRLGFSDRQIAYALSAASARLVSEGEVKAAREQAGVRPVFKAVDTCAGEFAADTPYHYSCYDEEQESQPTDRAKVAILGSGPNRIGQGIEFDYCCVHASFALREAGYETIMINCNPETVSTDYDTSDRLFFEPVTEEDVLSILDHEATKGKLEGVIVALGGQTPLKLAGRLGRHRVLGTSPASIDLAEDRERWNELCTSLGIDQPAGGWAHSQPDALAVAERVGYPVLVRPSYVLGGRGMEVVYDPAGLTEAMANIFQAMASEGHLPGERPVLIDHFLEDATEVDVDALRDAAGEVLIGAVMEHVEEAGIHSGDSACVLPPVHLDAALIKELEEMTTTIANALEVVGLVNVQFAIARGKPYVIEANPRASRTVPFVSKATGVPLARLAARVMVGATLAELRQAGEPVPVGRCPMATGWIAVKEAVLPFGRFRGVDTLLGPEMRSTGEVMGLADNYPEAFAKSQLAAGSPLPPSGLVLLSLADRDKAVGAELARELVRLGYELAATDGTASYLIEQGVPVAVRVAKMQSESGAELAKGDDPDAIELIEGGRLGLIINTPRGRGPRADGAYIRRSAAQWRVPCLTTISAARAAVTAMAVGSSSNSVCSLQHLHSLVGLV